VLCGALHIAYDTNNGVKGEYMISILYRSSLVLALASKGFATYDVFAVISLINARLEDSDNGRGMVSHGLQLGWIVSADQRS
jgi:hypothetical protein